jgi:polyribonucleotide nucleotidyltransferase
LPFTGPAEKGKLIYQYNRPENVGTQNQKNMSQIGITHSFDIGDGRIISMETGKLAKQADGAVVVRLGDTMILATIVSNKDAKEGVDFLPLTVDYQEKYASSGRFPGGFFKREARLSDYEVLISRIVESLTAPCVLSSLMITTQKRN